MNQQPCPGFHKLQSDISNMFAYLNHRIDQMESTLLNQVSPNPTVVVTPNLDTQELLDMIVAAQFGTGEAQPVIVSPDYGSTTGVLISTLSASPPPSIPTKCSNCHTEKTTTWRRIGGCSVCNSCGLYYKKHKIHRPISMRKEKIQQRCRRPKGQKSPGSDSSSEVSGDVVMNHLEQLLKLTE
ncbi:hypothetical protein GCK72_011453 [Caenorhabditis remanei]|uniref:GATA-type domain-containing protein n=1 Tax=Caenorhabditis remanei TaxID=31234 RepID=A0A6A5H7M8_CAERE|nr:hypothetical protein GCK72_011453 [Caenorhabditis remanei]KAF1763187.1 hypothetical protein GCK72_011453 [Caenorhabditis remanei]